MHLFYDKNYMLLKKKGGEKMRTIKLSLIITAIVVMAAIFGYVLASNHSSVKSAKAQVDQPIALTQTTGTTSLGDLIVLNGLFGSNGLGFNNPRNLAGLIAIDRISGGRTMGGTTNLGDLIVLNNLFGNGGFSNARDLAGLIAVDRITGR